MMFTEDSEPPSPMRTTRESLPNLGSPPPLPEPTYRSASDPLPPKPPSIPDSTNPPFVQDSATMPVEPELDEVPIKEEIVDNHTGLADRQTLTEILTMILDHDHALEQLERIASSATVSLEVIETILRQAAADGIEVTRLLRELQRVKSTARGDEVIVGLLGSSGAGKSSLINALLNEPSIVVTSSRAACTAVVTSIRYNHDPDPDKPYILEICYLSKKSWRNDIKLALEELQDRHNNQESDLAALKISMAKLRAVYPYLTDEDFRSMTSDDLVTELDHPECLGESIEYCGPVFKELKKSVEAIAKGRVNAAGDSESASVVPTLRGANWPLIKEVRIYVKKPLLANGLVLVDLPGSEDSNAARSAVAKEYQRKCARLLLVAPIKRAATEKNLHDLMTGSAKFDLARRDAFNTITVVCTQTDIITVENCCEEFDVSNKLQQLQKRFKKQEKVLLQAEQALKIKQNQLNKARGHGKSKGNSNKRIKTGSTSGAFARTSSSARRLPNTDTFTPLSLGNKRKLEQDQNDEVQALEQDVQDAQDKCEEMKVELYRLCIEERNEYTKKTIRADFAEEVEQIYIDLDQTGTTTTRDCKQYAEQLMVHTVSTSEYQRLKGNYRMSMDTEIFPNLTSTGIPGLRQDLKQTTNDQKLPMVQHYLQQVQAFLNSLEISMISDGLASKSTQQEQLKSWLNDRMLRFRKENEESTEAKFVTLAEKLNELMYDFLPGAAASAIARLAAKIEEWGPGTGENELKVSTVKAVCRRDGVYTQSSTKRRNIDFNADLSGIAYKGKISQQHPKTFNYLDEFVKEMKLDRAQRLKSLHEEVVLKCKEAGLVGGRLSLLEGQDKTVHTRLTTLTKRAEKHVKSTKHQAWDIVAECIKEAMQPLYEKCVKTTGNGCTGIIKKIIEDFLEEEYETMISNALEQFKNRIELGVSKVRKNSDKWNQEAADLFENEYRQLLFTSEATISEAELHMHDCIRQEIAKIELEISAMIPKPVVIKTEEVVEPDSTTLPGDNQDNLEEVEVREEQNDDNDGDDDGSDNDSVADDPIEPSDDESDDDYEPPEGDRMNLESGEADPASDKSRMAAPKLISIAKGVVGKQRHHDDKGDDDE